jgi:hypothetical protein
MQDKLRRLRLDELRGAPVYDNTGEQLGRIEHVVYDRQTRFPSWIRIGTGLFARKRVLVPVDGAVPHRDGIAVAYAKDYVRHSPDVDQEPISREFEAELATYYGVDHPASRSWLRDADRAMTRAEEEIRRPHDQGLWGAAEGVGRE